VHATLPEPLRALRQEASRSPLESDNLLATTPIASFFFLQVDMSSQNNILSRTVHAFPFIVCAGGMLYKLLLELRL
jgi:hypothetical protein